MRRAVRIRGNDEQEQVVFQTLLEIGGQGVYAGSAARRHAVQQDPSLGSDRVEGVSKVGVLADRHLEAAEAQVGGDGKSGVPSPQYRQVHHDISP